MKFRTAFTICFTTMLLAAVLALAVAEEALLYVPLVLLLVLLRMLMVRGEETIYVSKGLASALICFAFVFVGFDYRALSQQFLLSLAHFLVAVQAIRFFEAKRTRDYMLMVLLSVVQLAVAAIVSLEFALAVPMFVVFLVTPPVLIMLTILHGSETAAGQGMEGDVVLTPMTQELVLGARFWATSAIAAALCMGLAILVFVSVPRLRTHLFAQEIMAEPVPITGFDREVDLDDIGSIKQNTAEVMKVQIRRGGQAVMPVGIEPYWRGITLDRYEQGKWVSSAGAVRPVHASPGGVMRLENAYPSELRRLVNGTRGISLVQECTLQPLDTKILFGLYCITQVRSKRFGEVLFGVQDQTVRLRRGRTNTLQYTLRSTVYPLTEQAEKQLRAASGPIPKSIRQNYLRLPRVISPRVRALAASLVSPQGRYPTTYDRVQAVQAFFLLPGNFRYTLQLPEGKGREPIDAFLFETKAGHCSFFASAMVILLRSIGIPARMVNGFYGGEWNDFGRFFLVRQADAHSWVEVFFPRHGWITFDPTPAGNRVREAESGPFNAISKYIEYLDTLWLAYVVGYTADPSEEAAINFLERFRHWTRSWDSQSEFDQDELEASTQSLRRRFDMASGLLVGAVVIVIVLGAAIARIYGVRLLRHIAKRREVRPSIRFYRKFLDIMRRKGYPKLPSVTPLEFLRSLSGPGAVGRKCAAYVTECFCSVRYGDRQISKGEGAKLNDCLLRLAHAPRRSPAEPADDAGPTDEPLDARAPASGTST